MYIVRTVARWKNHITETDYTFSSALEMYRFIHLCNLDGIKFEVIKKIKNTA